MCFSVTADLVAGAALTPVAVLSLREVRHWREVPYASLPAVFAAHQLIEAFVWAWQDGGVSPAVGHSAAVIYVFIAWPLLPALVPVAVFLLEPRETRTRWERGRLRRQHAPAGEDVDEPRGRRHRAWVEPGGVEFPSAEPVVRPRHRKTGFLAERPKPRLELAADHGRAGDLVERPQQFGLAGGLPKRVRPGVEKVW